MLPSRTNAGVRQLGCVKGQSEEGSGGTQRSTLNSETVELSRGRSVVGGPGEMTQPKYTNSKAD